MMNKTKLVKQIGEYIKTQTENTGFWEHYSIDEVLSPNTDGIMEADLYEVGVFDDVGFEYDESEGFEKMNTEWILEWYPCYLQAKKKYLDEDDTIFRTSDKKGKHIYYTKSIKVVAELIFEDLLS